MPPFIVEDFSSYADTAALRADPRGIYRAGEDINAGQIVLDTSVGFGASDRSMRYDYPTGISGAEYTISRWIDLPSLTEVWASRWFRTSPGFRIDGPGSGGISMKWEFVMCQPGDRRFGLLWTGQDEGFYAEPPVDGNYEGFFMRNTSVNFNSINDGEWHCSAIHVKLDGGQDVYEYWLDGVLMGSETGAITRTNRLDGLVLCRNINRPMAVRQSLWFGRIDIYDTDPGPGWLDAPAPPLTPLEEVFVDAVADADAVGAFRVDEGFRGEAVLSAQGWIEPHATKPWMWQLTTAGQAKATALSQQIRYTLRNMAADNAIQLTYLDQRIATATGRELEWCQRVRAWVDGRRTRQAAEDNPYLGG